MNNNSAVAEDCLTSPTGLSRAKTQEEDIKHIKIERQDVKRGCESFISSQCLLKYRHTPTDGILVKPSQPSGIIKGD